MMSGVDYCTSPLSQYTINNFNMVSTEVQSIKTLKSVIFQYMITKATCTSNMVFPSLCQFIQSANYGHLDNEISKVHFMEVLSLKADSKDTITLIIKQVYDRFICQQHLQWVLVVGDAKTYDILQKVKKEYCLHWLLVFPGDWHLLHNYQKAIIKVYWDAGLCQLAQASGHNGETLTSLSKAGNFRHTHHFFLQAFEALYMSFIHSFLKYNQQVSSELNFLQPNLIELERATNNDQLEHAIDQIQSYFHDCNLYDRFMTHIKQIGELNETSVFWSRFIEIDIFTYIALFTAIRNCDWQLRVASIKLMAPISLP
jgi:hypothetical protein